ncbi:hypothetical protein CCM_00775 [Cordyceps militaris CM01]|uniref:Uncharacterized protein n=1 Tax=Cordyceps militaris (strain CM01) TaxID=983644 RepID=G3J616_CORMM|nr:uncharacterized protein CCM_00775 [Cordyceps militaris CM01]EGX96120.1 hypothetical protein CCM_00775 [Cordyceps militaris CM01]
MADSDGSNSPPARAEQKTAASREALAEIIAAQTQPGNATHLSLPGSEYLASGDFHLSPSASPTVHLEAAHLRLQDILDDTDDENAERYVVEETGELVDEETMLLEREVYVQRESMAIKWLRERKVPLLYHPRYLGRVFEQPNRFAGMIRPFYLHPPLDFDAPEANFFERQCLRFEEFTRWQSYHRDIDTMQEEFMVESYNAALVREATSAREWRALMANPKLAHSAARQEEFWNRRREEKELLHDDECANFDEYRAGVVARLARNGVQVSAGFDLLVDFWLQDRLTMWTEYLAFEYWHMEQMSDDVTDWRVRHDEAYERLRQKTALGAHETPEYLPTQEAQTQRRVERDQAYRQLDLAALEFARLQRQPRGRSHEQMFMSHIRRTRMLAEAQVQLDAAEEAKDAMLRHEEAVVQFLHETETYREACDIRDRHEYLLAWAKDRYYEIRCETGQMPPGRAPRVSFLSARVMPEDSATTSQRHLLGPRELFQMHRSPPTYPGREGVPASQRSAKGH